MRFFYCCVAMLFTWLPWHTHAQLLLKRTVSVSVSNKSLSAVLHEIEKQGGFAFSYNSNILNKDSLVSVDAHGWTARALLDTLLGKRFRYKETEHYVIIQLAEHEKWYYVTGFITDGVTGRALEDVTVFERQQLASAMTDSRGYFKLPLRDRGANRYAEITVSKGFYQDTTISLMRGFDQELALTIAPTTYALPDMVITQNSGVERSWLGRLLVSSRLKKQSFNLGKFFVDKPYQVSLLPGIGTHGRMSGQVDNKFSFNLLGGYTAGVTGAELGGFFNINKRDVKYVQVAGMGNVVAGKVTGVQAAGFVNVTLDSVKGVQAAGFVNGAKTANVQVAGFVNGAIAIEGVQAAGSVNVAKRVKGLQIAGYVNIAKEVKGVQLSSLVNVAKDVEGVQASSFVNVARRVKGVQVCAFVNVADSCDFPIAFINVIGNGDMGLGLTRDEIGTTMLAFRSGGRILYGLVGLGLGQQYDAGLLATELGMGAHIRLSKRFRINTELSLMSVSNFVDSVMVDNGLRVMPSVRFGPIEIFAGPGLAYSYHNFDLQYKWPEGATLWNIAKEQELRLTYRAGLQVHL